MPVSTQAPHQQHLADGTPYFGQLGEVAYDPVEDRVQCHLCGEWFKWVGGLHLKYRHGWKIADYRRAFGLSNSQSTMAAGSRALLRAHAIERLSEARLGSPLGGGRGLQQKGWRSLKERHPDLVGELHPHRNGDLDPTILGVWSKEIVWWRCRKCGCDWRASVEGRAAYHGGCPACGPRAGSRHRTRAHPRTREHSLAALRPDLAVQVHPTRNGDLDPWSFGLWSKRKLWWRCPDCGHEWETRVSNRAQGTGCPHCAKARRAATFEENQQHRGLASSAVVVGSTSGGGGGR